MVKNQGKRNRQRGQEYEREIVDFFQKHGFSEARRNLQSQGGNKVGNDIANVPFAVECKRTAASLIPKAEKAWEQCDADAKAIHDPNPRIIVTRKDGSKDDFVVMKLSDFAKLLPEPAVDPDFDYPVGGW
jgi:hypothetical protein